MARVCIRPSENIHRIAKGTVLSSTVEGKFRDESRFRPVPRIISPLNIESTMAPVFWPYSATSRVISSSGSRSHLAQPLVAEVSSCLLARNLASSRRCPSALLLLLVFYFAFFLLLRFPFVHAFSPLFALAHCWPRNYMELGVSNCLQRIFEDKK